MTRTTGRFAFVAILVATAAAGARAQAPPGAVTVAQAVTEAVDHNLSLLAERYNVTVADAAVLTAGLRPNPVFTADVILPDSNLMDTGVGLREGVVRTDYVVERAGKRDRRIDQATLARSVAELQLLDSTRRLVLDVESACADVQLARLNLSLAQENLDAFNNVVGVNVERVRTGDLAEVELARSRLAALQFRNDVEQQTARLAVARTRLEGLLGRRPAGAIEVIGNLRDDPAALDRDVLLTRALEMRPDVRAARADQARSVADLRLQLANGKIDYTISGEYHRQNGKGFTGDVSGNTYAVYFSVPVPIFNRNQGEVARARTQQQQLDAKTRALEADVVAGLDSAFIEYTSARTIVERIERDMLMQARDVRTTMEYSYRRGEASLVEFLDAVRTFNDTTRGYNEARADYARSLYTLDAIAGKVTP